MTSFAVSGFARARRPVAAAVPCGLAFDRPGGPLVAVCGVAGGAGTSTLALALARQASRESMAPVLLCEADSRAGGMAALCQAASEHSLGELAAIAVRGGSLRSPPYVEFERGLRLIAGPPGSDVGEPEEIRQLLAEARRAHGLVVADSGVVGGSAASSVLAAATHVLLVMPATPIGVTRGAQLLTSRIAPQQSVTLIAVAPAAKSVRPRVLRDLAEPFVERLVFVPHVAGLVRGETAGTQLDLSLVALASALRTAA